MDLAAGIPFARGLRSIGNKIHAAARERMAARKAPQGEPRAMPRAVKSQGIGGVM